MERETGWVDFQRLEARGWKRVKAPSELRDALRRSSGIDVREDELELGLRQRPRVSQRSGAGAGTGHCLNEYLIGGHRLEYPVLNSDTSRPSDADVVKVEVPALSRPR
jgi:hypothetical protein